jgi:GTPase SAR1 family protein
MKVAILGNAGVGKSCLVTRLMSVGAKGDNQYPFKSGYVQTFGVDISNLSTEKYTFKYIFYNHIYLKTIFL